MSWFDADHHGRDHHKKEPDSMASRFFTASLLILGGILVLTFALQLLAQIWIWLLLIALIVAAIWIAIRIWLHRRDPW